jgi:hypothetical protein
MPFLLSVERDHDKHYTIKMILLAPSEAVEIDDSAAGVGVAAAAVAAAVVVAAAAAAFVFAAALVAS